MYIKKRKDISSKESQAIERHKRASARYKLTMCSRESKVLREREVERPYKVSKRTLTLKVFMRVMEKEIESENSLRAYRSRQDCKSKREKEVECKKYKLIKIARKSTGGYES